MAKLDIALASLGNVGAEGCESGGGVLMTYLLIALLAIAFVACIVWLSRWNAEVMRRDVPEMRHDRS